MRTEIQSSDETIILQEEARVLANRGRADPGSGEQIVVEQTLMEEHEEEPIPLWHRDTVAGGGVRRAWKLRPQSIEEKPS